MNGILIYFDDARNEAFVWCDRLDTGLNILKKSRFPTIWDQLEVGSAILFETDDSASIRYVTRVLEINGIKQFTKQASDQATAASCVN